MLVVFPFEKDLYENAGIKVDYVGHPLVENISTYNYMGRKEFFEKFNLDINKEILLILPGSRKQEIIRIFPPAVKAAQKLAAEFDMQTIVACSQNFDPGIFESLTSIRDFRVIKGHNYDLFKYSKFGIIKSGTSTLEAGLFTLPFIVVYATGFITYLIGKSIIKIKNIAMANIISGEKIVEELIQNQVNSKLIYEKCKSILMDKNKYDFIKGKLGVIQSRLGMIGASSKAAEIIYAELNET